MACIRGLIHALFSTPGLHMIRARNRHGDVLQREGVLKINPKIIDAVQRANRHTGAA